MALGTLHLVLGDVDAVDQCSVVELVEPLRLVVAGEAAIAVGDTGPVDHVFVAAGARHQVLDVLGMIDDKARRRREAWGRAMAARTAGDRFTARTVLEVAEVTGLGGDGDMGALNDL